MAGAPQVAPSPPAPGPAPTLQGPMGDPQGSDEDDGQRACQAKRVDNADHLIAALFLQLNISGTDKLNCAEMKPFAELIGFRGSPAQWETEFVGVCRYLGCDPCVGIDSAAFARLLSDTSRRGCFCTAAEIRTLLRKTARVQFRVDYEATFDATSEISDGMDCDIFTGLAFSRTPPPSALDTVIDSTSECRSCSTNCGNGISSLQRIADLA
eukprot:CAMPEP_0206602510 /NCGR_PEP_ID=MMETSP0325_2-20121206/47455_1 /ASSEMBLY_ACC=CAM_ASM_000347 /TAXON_ID=2866 /ORGANISM="Crypthecodinium cohnii, Strain Seligo" /LENGTH=210 /DNA_ID=CAMNT_0054115061 /DNA_START=265 /DNA_END=894 /DNA_ORIENTATION=-